MRLAVPVDATFLGWRVFEPLRRCGEHSLLVFCLDTSPALSGQIVVSYFEEQLLSQIFVSVAGIGRMCGVAYIATWFKAGSAGARSAAGVAP